MNEEAIDIMYKVAIDEGYRKSKDFLKLMSEDFDALMTMYENAKDEGYTKEVEDFALLFGTKLTENQTSAFWIPSKDGSSEFQQTSKTELEKHKN